MMLVPVIAIVGRPNVGKSTLFNALTKTQDALVFDRPGVTRDRIFGEGRLSSDESQKYIVIDTGGIYGLDGSIDSAETVVDDCMAKQSLIAASESDAILWLVDARAGLTAVDERIAEQLRGLNKQVFIVVNKVDGLDPDVVIADFYSLGMGEPLAISASHRRGLMSLIDFVFENLQFDLQTDLYENNDPQLGSEQDFDEDADELEQEQADIFPNKVKVAVIGRPNVGKSTLINRLLGESRVVVFDEPGTTRDSIYIPFTRDDRDYVLIDTAGIRRRGKVIDVIEKFSVIKTLKAIRDCNVVILLIDSTEQLTEQDLHLLGYTQEQGKSLIIACNKWDGLDEDQKERIKTELDRRLVFAKYAERVFISAKHGTNVGNLWKTILACYDSAMQDASASKLTEILAQAVHASQPPMAHGRRIKLNFAHLGSNYPFLIVIHGKQTSALPEHYRRYLSKFFQEKLKLIGTPILLELKTDDNPYAGVTNTLTPRQYYKRQRLIKHRKSMK